MGSILIFSALVTRSDSDCDWEQTLFLGCLLFYRRTCSIKLTGLLRVSRLCSRSASALTTWNLSQEFSFFSPLFTWWYAISGEVHMSVSWRWNGADVKALKVGK